MANKLETTQVTFNDEKIACARFTIDDISVPFVLKNIAVTGKDYTFSLYLKSNGDSSISVEGNNITSTTAWTRQYVTFSATKANVEISFNKTGTYYFYNTQLETGKICSDWTPNPEDISEDVLNAETIAKQTATKFSWLVKSGTSESNFELTDRTISLISKNINLNGIVTFMNTAKGEVYKNLYASTGYADFESIKSTDDAICYAKLDSNSVAIDSSTYWQGSNSLKISGTEKNLVRVYLGNKENNYGCIKVEQGKTYQITAYVKSDSEQNVSFGIDWITHGTKIDAATGTCYIESYLFNPQKPSFPKGCTTITPNTSWQRAITTFTVTDKTNSYYYISIVPTIYNQLSKNANFWVDGIMVEEVESLNSEPNEFTNSVKATIIDGNSILTDSITADKLTANSITAEKIMADALKSKNYVVGESGSFLNLADGSFDSKYLKWDSVGKITASMGKIANWNINSTSIYKGDGWKSSTPGSAYFGDNGLSITDKFLVDSSGNVSTSHIVITGGSINISDGNFIADFEGNVEMKGKITSSNGNIAGWTLNNNSLKSIYNEITVLLQSNNYKILSCVNAGNKTDSNHGDLSIEFSSFLNEDINTTIKNAPIIDMTSYYNCTDENENGYFRNYISPSYMSISKYVDDVEKNSAFFSDGKIKLSRSDASIKFITIDPDGIYNSKLSIKFENLISTTSCVVCHYWGNTFAECTTTNNSYVSVPAFTTNESVMSNKLYTKVSDNQIKILKKGVYLFQVRLATKSRTANKRCIFAPFINGNQVKAYAITPYSPVVATYITLEHFTISLDANSTVDFRMAAMEKVVCELQIQDIYVHAIDYDGKYGYGY